MPSFVQVGLVDILEVYVCVCNEVIFAYPFPCRTPLLIDVLDSLAVFTWPDPPLPPVPNDSPEE